MENFRPHRLILCSAILAGVFLADGPRLAPPPARAAETLPRLAFTMTRASDGKTVTAANYRGKVVLLYFGYTSCSDICPATLLNVTTILKAMSKEADSVRVLFVTVDPNRDTLAVLKRYTGSFAPQVVGLRGTPAQIAALAGRYHAPYSVTPADRGHPYEVTHSAAIYVFDANGQNKATLIGLSAGRSNLIPMTNYLSELVAGSTETN